MSVLYQPPGQRSDLRVRTRRSLHPCSLPIRGAGAANSASYATATRRPDSSKDHLKLLEMAKNPG